MNNECLYWSLCITVFLLAYCVFENWYLRRKIKRLSRKASNWEDICERYRNEKINQSGNVTSVPSGLPREEVRELIIGRGITHDK